MEMSPEDCRARIQLPWGYYSKDGKVLVSRHGDVYKQQNLDHARASGPFCR